MFLMSVPSAETVRDFLDSERDLPFSYDEVGITQEYATRDDAPPGYTADRYHILLGEGPETFEKAKNALRSWGQFELEWVELLPRKAPIEPGVTVAVIARHYGFISLNSARIVHIVEDHGPVERYGFAYGTLPGHAEKGEERFTIEWDRENGAVFYNVLAFSQPDHLLARLGAPFARRLQNRFARDSVRAMDSATKR